MDTQPENEPQTQTPASIPTVEEVMKRYNLTDPGVGYEMWRIVTRSLRYPSWRPETSGRGANVVIRSTGIMASLQDNPERS